MPRPFREVSVRSRGQTAYWVLIGAAFVSSWTSIRTVAALQPVDVLLVLAALLGIRSFWTRPILPPWWLTVGVLTVVLTWIVHVVSPTSYLYLATRFEPQGVSAMTGAVVESGSVRAAQWLVAMAALPFIFANIVVKANRRPEAVVVAWAIGAAVSAAIGASEHLGYTRLGTQLIGYENTSGRESGLASHPNDLGFACAVALPVAIQMLRAKPLLGSATLLGLAGGTLVSGSRGAQIGFVLAAALTLVLTPGGRKLCAPLLFAVTSLTVLALLFAPWTFTATLSEFTRFDVSESYASDYGRRLLIAQAIEDFELRPFAGIGFEVLTAAHSVPLQVLASGGLLLGTGMAIFWWGAVVVSRRLPGMGPAVGCSVLVWLLVGLVENQLTDRYLYFPIAAIAALVAVQRHVEGNDSSLRLRQRHQTPDGSCSGNARAAGNTEAGS